jgi:hypothetical protein
VVGRILIRVLVAGCAAIWAQQARGYRMELGRHPAELGISASVREVIEENRATQHERTQGKLRVSPRLDWSPGLRLAGSIVGTVGGPTMQARRSGFFHWRQVFQNRSPALDLEEIYLDGAWNDFDFRIGKQRVAWGKLDRFSPVDVFNTLAYTDPFLLEEGERRIGTPSVRVTYNLPDSVGFQELRWSVVWAPLYLPYRFPDARCELDFSGRSACIAERWFPPAAVPPSTFVIPSKLLPGSGAGGLPDVSVPLTFRVRNEAPRATLRDGSFGTRLAGRVSDVDTSLYYFHGYDSQTAFLLEAWATGTPDANPANPLGVRDVVGHTFLRPVFRAIDLWGADAAYSWENLTFRGDIAFVSGRPFARDIRSLVADPTAIAPELRRALAALARGAGATPVVLPDSFVIRNAVEWGGGMDLLVRGWLFMLQVNQTDVLSNSVRLLIRDIETRVLLTVRKNFLAERLQGNLLGGYGIDSDYSFLRPRLTYKWNDYLSTEVGYLFIAGRRQSLIGQYRRNDQGWLQVSLRF